MTLIFIPHTTVSEPRDVFSDKGSTDSSKNEWYAPVSLRIVTGTLSFSSPVNETKPHDTTADQCQFSGFVQPPRAPLASKRF